MPGTVSIQTVAELTGLTPHAIRAWERRYGAIAPARSQGKHRMYSEADVCRLSLLAEATRSGKSISRLAHLDNVALRNLATRRVPQPRDLPAFQSLPDAHPEEALFLEKALVAVTNLDTLALDQVYQKAQVSFGDQGLLRRVIAPLARDIGERWRAGLMTAAQEHFFSAFSKNFAWNLTRQYEVDERAPKIVVGTPAGQIHDLGAMIVAAAAANNGWRVVYVGANLPAFELAGAVQISGAAVLVLSIVYPEDDPKLQNELTHLGRLLPQETKLYVGGRAARAYFPDLKRSRAMVLSSLEELDRELDAARKASSLQPGLR